MNANLSGATTVKGKRENREHKIRKTVRKCIAIVLAAAMLNLTGGCRSYFKVNASPEISSNAVAGLDAAGKTFIVHFDRKVWLMENLQVINDTIKGDVQEYDKPPTKNPVKEKRPNRYIAKAAGDQRYLLKEVHLYAGEYIDLGNNRVALPVSSLQKINIYDKDTAATVGSWILGGLGVTVGAYLLVGIIALIFKESCPFIYTWDGENYHFAGEIYSGSIHKPLERHDYLKLSDYPGQTAYTLKITNEVREIQHTNLLELLVFDHPSGTGVFVDKYGEVKTLRIPVSPEKAYNLAGEEVTSLVTNKNDLYYQSPANPDKEALKDGLVMEFPNEENAERAKIVVRAKNSILLDYTMGQFHDLFGSLYQPYMKKQQNASAEMLRKWTLEQGIPLSLYVERNGTWEYADYYHIAGPMAFKEDVLEVPLTGTEGNPLRVKLEYGSYLWEIDSVAADYSQNEKVTCYTVPVTTALSEDDKDVAGLLSKDDGKYYTQPDIGNAAVVTFTLPVPEEQSRSIVLHSKGWYQVLRDPQGKPDKEYLQAFRQPGRFNQFTLEQIMKFDLKNFRPQHNN